MNNNLYLDSNSGKRFDYISDCLNLFIPVFLDHKLYRKKGTHGVGSKEIYDNDGNVYVVWYPKFNLAPNSSGYFNHLEDNESTIIEENSKKDMDFGTNWDVPRIVFTKQVGEGYRFLGIFQVNKEESKKRRKVYNKIADIADFTQNPPIIHYLKDNERETVFAEMEKEISEIDDIPNITETEKEIIAKQRKGQQWFRNQLIKKYKCCQICGLKNRKMLMASHIKDWSKSTNEERLDINNGLLLCAQHDALFDNDLITFDEDGKIMISESLSQEDREVLQLADNIQIEMNEEMKEYMQWHTNDVWENSKVIKHEKYGIGIVTNVNDGISTIEFISGEAKKFKIKEVPAGVLKKVF